MAIIRLLGLAAPLLAPLLLAGVALADEAERWALQEARARLIAAATGVALPLPFGRERDEAALLRMAEHAAIYEERWDGNGRLEATIATVGGTLAPPLEARLASDLLAEGGRIALAVFAAPARRHLAVYGWQADDRVVRLYPDAGGAAIAVDSGEPLALPAAGMAVYRVALPKDLSRATEAVVVLASSRPFDAAGLAPVAATVDAGVPAAGFFAALATRLDLRATRLRVLPLRIEGAVDTQSRKSG